MVEIKLMTLAGDLALIPQGRICVKNNHIIQEPIVSAINRLRSRSRNIKFKYIVVYEKLGQV